MKLNDYKILCLSPEFLLMKNLAKQNGWDLISSEKQFKEINISDYYQIIIDAELNWEDCVNCHFYGLRLAWNLQKKYPELSERQIIFSKCSLDFLKSNYPNLYNKALIASQGLFHFRDLRKKDKIVEGRFLLTKSQRYKHGIEILEVLFLDYHSHDTSILDIISSCQLSLTNLLESDRIYWDVNYFSSTKEQMAAILYVIKTAADNIVNGTIKINKPEFYAAKFYSRKIIVELNRIEYSIKRNDIPETEISNNVKKVKEDLKKLGELFEYLSEHGRKHRVKKQIKS